MIVDAHQHFWDRNHPTFDHSWQESEGLEKICRTFLPTDLKPLIDEVGVDRTVFVQTQHNVEENAWVLELADQTDFVCGVVGWVDLTSEAVEDQLLRFKDHSKFVGIRHVTQDEPDDDFIVSAPVSRGLKVLEKHKFPFDLLFYAKHLHHAPTVADRFPELPLVIDHLSKPNIKDKGLKPWTDQLLEAAKRPNVYCKLSGMVTEADLENWRVEDLQPFVEKAIEAFTPDRLMFGSDWPVCELAASYSEVYQALQTCIDGLSDSEKAKVMGETAIRFYGLHV